MAQRLMAWTAGALVAGAVPALAGGPTPVMAEPVVMAPMVVPEPSYDWTGPYVGGQLGWAWSDGSGTNEFDGLDISSSGVIGGLTGGYRFDMGQWVVGGELQYDWSDSEWDEVELGDFGLDVDDKGRIQDIWRLKGLVGYDLGRTLVYGSVGWAGATAEVGDESMDSTGWLIGAGVDYMLTDRFSVGGEVMYHTFDEFGDEGQNFDLNVTTLQAKATFRF